jgi:magnesium-transporting ATPase (P-type)
MHRHNHHLHDVSGDMDHMKDYQHAAWHVPVYWGLTVLCALAIATAAFCIGYFAFEENLAEYGMGADAIPSIVLETNKPEYASLKISPTSEWDDRVFLRYVSIILWLAVIITGLGMEVVVGEPLVQYLMAKDAKTAGAAWHGAQLIFSLSISVALVSRVRPCRRG